MPRIWDTLGTFFLLDPVHLMRGISQRNYVTQDILRRIMSDYFGYDVHFVMNVTDIDDKVRVLLVLLVCAVLILCRSFFAPDNNILYKSSGLKLRN